MTHTSLPTVRQLLGEGVRHQHANHSQRVVPHFGDCCFAVRPWGRNGHWTDELYIENRLVPAATSGYLPTATRTWIFTLMSSRVWSTSCSVKPKRVAAPLKRIDYERIKLNLNTKTPCLCTASFTTRQNLCDLLVLHHWIHLTLLVKCCYLRSLDVWRTRCLYCRTEYADVLSLCSSIGLLAIRSPE